MLTRTAAVALLLVVGAPSGSAAPGGTESWQPYVDAPSAQDLAGPRHDGRFMLQAGGGLWLWRPGSSPTPYARGPEGYSTGVGSESYIALSPGRRQSARECSFGRGAVYAIEPSNHTIVKVTRSGTASTFATLPDGFLNGIAFDRVGRFGHRLLVTDSVDGAINLYGLDCRGRSRTFGTGLPRVEGGMVVAPRGFGRFGGQLIAPDEHGGAIYAFAPDGSSHRIARSGLPSGADIGVESAGFIPPSASEHRVAAYVSSAHGSTTGPGADSILRLGGRAIHRLPLRPGDLLVASETAATSVRVRCGSRRCSVQKVADGPPAAHVEGHVVFSAR